MRDFMRQYPPQLLRLFTTIGDIESGFDHQSGPVVYPNRTWRYRLAEQG